MWSSMYRRNVVHVTSRSNEIHMPGHFLFKITLSYVTSHETFVDHLTLVENKTWLLYRGTLGSGGRANSSVPNLNVLTNARLMWSSNPWSGEFMPCAGEGMSTPAIQVSPTKILWYHLADMKRNIHVWRSIHNLEIRSDKGVPRWPILLVSVESLTGRLADQRRQLGYHQRCPWPEWRTSYMDKTGPTALYSIWK